jgi:hypothetical protein
MLEIIGYKSIEFGTRQITKYISLEILFLNPNYELYITEFWTKTFYTNAISVCPPNQNKTQSIGAKMCYCIPGYVFIPNSTDC